YIWHIDAATGTGQARGPFGQTVTNGFACYACGIAAMIAYSQWQARWARRLAGAVAVVSLLGCMLSLERGVWIGAAAGAVAVGFLAHDARRWLPHAAAVAAVSIAVLLAFGPSLANHASARAGTQQSVWDR